MNVNVLAAAAAASIAYGTHEEDNTTLPRMDTFWLAEPKEAPNEGGREATLAAAEHAAAFLRKWPKESPEAAAIHMKRCGAPVPALDHRRRAAWKVFAATLAALDEADRAMKADAEAERRAAVRRGPTARDVDELTYAPEKKTNELSELGRSTRLESRKESRKGQE